jgi:hypothetical protein
MIPTDSGPALPISKVVAAIASRRGSRELIEASMLAARALNVGLQGIHIRDPGLLHAASLPCSAFISIGGGPSERPTAAVLGRLWRREEAWLRQLMAAGADLPVDWSLSAFLGGLDAAVASAAAGEALVAISTESFELGHRESLALNAAGAAAAVLLVPPLARGGQRGPILAIDEGGAAGGLAVATAARIAEVASLPLAVLVLGSPERAETIVARRKAFAGAVAVHAWPEWLAEELVAPIHRISPYMVVRAAPTATRDVAARFARRAAAPLLLLDAEL